jgi:hypothetical protein
LEFHADANLRHQLGSKIRPERKGLGALLDRTAGTTPGSLVGWSFCSADIKHGVFPRNCYFSALL